MYSVSHLCARLNSVQVLGPSPPKAAVCFSLPAPQYNVCFSNNSIWLRPIRVERAQFPVQQLLCGELMEMGVDMPFLTVFHNYGSLFV